LLNCIAQNAPGGPLPKAAISAARCSSTGLVAQNAQQEGRRYRRDAPRDGQVVADGQPAEEFPDDRSPASDAPRPCARSIEATAAAVEQLTLAFTCRQKVERGCKKQSRISTGAKLECASRDTGEVVPTVSSCSRLVLGALLSKRVLGMKQEA
jgi:hypothetical protein